MRTRVLAVGGGPVGLTLAMDLAWRGIDVIVAERRPPNDPPNVKCGQIGARSMEIFRRLGVADKLRGIGLPPAYPNDIVSATSVTGIELSRVLIPGRGARGTPAAPGPERRRRDRERRRPRWRHTFKDRMRLPRRLRRSEFLCAQVDWVRIRRHP